MDILKLIYKILAYMYNQTKNELFDEEHFTADYFKCSEAEFTNALIMLVDKGYILGIEVEYFKEGSFVAIINPRITLDGIEYLQENSTMKKIYKTLKGIKETMPGI